MRKTKEIFMQNLRRGRRSLRLTQAEFAEAVDMSLRGYQKYEQGESAPTPEVLERFAKHIGCEPWELVMPERQAPKASADASAISFLTRLGALSPLRQKIVLTLVFDDAAHMRGASHNSIQAVESLLKGHS